jgi:hypothetical protein
MKKKSLPVAQFLVALGGMVATLGTMVPMHYTKSIDRLLLLVWGLLMPVAAFASENLAAGVSVTASSERGAASAAKAVDGMVADDSRWLAAADDRDPWIEIDFGAERKVAVVDVFSGWKTRDPMASFDLEVWDGREWLAEPAWRVRGNRETARRVVMGRNTAKLRLRVRPGGKDLAGRIREIAVYEDPGTTVTAGLKGGALSLAPIPRDRHLVALNQVGFERGRSKRFTAPLSSDGTRFTVRAATGGEPLFRGQIEGKIGDFSKFRPEGSAAEYVVELRGGNLKAGVSDPFVIQENFWKDTFWQPAADFLIDTRAVVGTHPSAYGGCPWRDGTYYDAMIPALVMFYLAEPARIGAMPRQIDWAADKNRVLDPGFKFDARNPNPEGVMDAVRAYYTELEPPKPDAPDVVKLIHWGAGYYCLNPATRDPSRDPLGRRVHSQTIEQVAYVLWAWPALKKWLPESFHERCRDLCFKHWESMGALEVPDLWEIESYQVDVGGKAKNPGGGIMLHPYKGRHAPGHSIVPNLIMHEVAKREERDDAGRYLGAAVKQAGWIIRHLDWNDPRTTKGHRMSEHRTITNLVWMLQKYPGEAPRGLQHKIEEWAKVAVERSENMWDFRRYDLGGHWTIPTFNDVGNWLSAPAMLLSASWVVGDEALRIRLQEIAVAQADAVFGRNPRLAAAPNHPEMGFTGIERGWPKSHPDNLCARLELCRGSIASGPGTEMFPFNPEGSYRHPEGWVNYGASWCLSLAYMACDEAGKTTPDP